MLFVKLKAPSLAKTFVWIGVQLVNGRATFVEDRNGNRRDAERAEERREMSREKAQNAQKRNSL